MPVSGGPRVLVVDDDPAARYGMARALDRDCGEVREASDGAQALEAAAEFRPHVVVSDVNMPVMDGITMLEKLRQIADPPLVILVTAYGSENVAIQALRCGAYDYLAKPYEIDELRARVANAAERQRLSAELKLSQTALVQSRKMAAIAEVASGVAHEINNPLGALHSSVQTVQSAASRLSEELSHIDAVPATRAEALLGTLRDSAATALHACTRIRDAVGDLRRFAQLDRADVQRFNVNDCVSCVAGVLGSEFGGDVRLDLVLTDVPFVDGSPRDVNQLIYNLVRNGLEAVRRAGRPGYVCVRTAATDDGIQMEVEDNGCGIPESKLASLFEPAFVTRGGRVGFGLGLPVCYGIVEAHHGNIRVTSRAGEGTTFTVGLPKKGMQA